MTNLLNSDRQSIVALCTPRGSGALGLIRITGADALRVGSSLARLSSGQVLEQVSSHTIHHGAVINAQGEILDHVLFLVMHAPRTFTGDNTVEITCHNNPFVIEAIINAACAAGARPAEAGEFTKRAFLNDKIDLVQAEAINDLIHAQSHEALKRSLSQLKGTLSHEIAALEEDLVALTAYVEASFDFLDEEQRDLDFATFVKNKTDEIIKRLQSLIAHHDQQKVIKEGVRIALVGAVNAGKSTLFNRLVGSDRAIVTDIAGTTRDAIEAVVYKNGLFHLYVDTAGLRQTSDVVEKIGIERSFQQAALADVVLLVIDSARELLDAEREHYNALLKEHAHKVIVVMNKVDQDQIVFVHDLVIPGGTPLVSLSAEKAQGLDQLAHHINSIIVKLIEQSQSPYLLSQRQIKLLSEILSGLQNVANTYAEELHYELIAYNLKSLLERVSELTGKNVSERVMDAVFREFCVGK